MSPSTVVLVVSGPTVATEEYAPQLPPTTPARCTSWYDSPVVPSVQSRRIRESDSAVAPSPLGAPATGAVAGRHAPTRAPTSRRPPVAVMPSSDAVGAAVERMAARIWGAVMAGFIDAQRAAAPETCGVAIDVPLYEA